MSSPVPHQPIGLPGSDCRGSMTILGAAIISVLVLLTGVGLPVLAKIWSVSAQAETAAEAVALAVAPATFPPTGLTDLPALARRYSQANGAELLTCRCPINTDWQPRQVEVEVRIGVQIPGWGKIYIPGRARAEFDPVVWITGKPLPPPQIFPFLSDQDQS